MEDFELGNKIKGLAEEVKSLSSYLQQLKAQTSSVKDDTGRYRLESETAKTSGQLEAKSKEMDDLRSINNAETKEPRFFVLRAPEFRTQRATKGPRQWTVLDAEIRDKLNMYVKPSDPIMRLGDTQGPWEAELKVPQKHIGQVLRAYTELGTSKLDVDLLVTSAPTRKFRGVLLRDKLSGEAMPNRDEHNESAPVVMGYVSLDDPSIPEDLRVPPELFVSGVQVHATVRCGNRAMGYSLFYGLWEFFYEKVVFFF